MFFTRERRLFCSQHSLANGENEQKRSDRILYHRLSSPKPHLVPLRTVLQPARIQRRLRSTVFHTLEKYVGLAFLGGAAPYRYQQSCGKTTVGGEACLLAWSTADLRLHDRWGNLSLSGIGVLIVISGISWLMRSSRSWVERIRSHDANDCVQCILVLHSSPGTIRE